MSEKRYEKIHEPVSTYVFSRQGRTKIKAFEWNGRIYQMTGDNLITRARKGTTPVYLFSVSNNKGAYKLRFDTDTLNWWLEEILWED